MSFQVTCWNDGENLLMLIKKKKKPNKTNKMNQACLDG